jgi:hypothetical protein
MNKFTNHIFQADKIKKGDSKVVFCTTSKSLAGISGMHSYISPLSSSDDVFYIDEFDKQYKVILNTLFEKRSYKQIEHLNIIFNHSDKKNYFKINDNHGNGEFDEILNEFFKKDSIVNFINKYQIDDAIRFDMPKDQSVNLFTDGINAFSNDLSRDSLIYKTDYKQEGFNRIDTTDSYNSTKDILFKNFIYEACQLIDSEFTNLMEKLCNKYIKNTTVNDEKIENEVALMSIMKQLKMAKDNDNFDPTSLYFRVVNNIKDHKRINKKTEFQYGGNHYERGVQITTIQNNELDLETSEVTYKDIKESPNKILLDLCKNNMIIGISATAKCETVINNFDIKYLKKNLNKNFHVLNKKEIKKIEQEKMSFYRDYYKKGGEINTMICKNDDESLRILINKYFTNEKKAADLITKLTSNNKYISAKITSILNAIEEFCLNPNSRYLVCFLTKFYKKSDFDDYQRIIALKEIINKINSQCELFSEVDSTYMKYSFDENVLNRCLFKEGKKAIIFTTFATVSSGANMQRRINDFEKNKIICLNKDFDNGEVDIDSIYVDMPTNIIGEHYIKLSELLNSKIKLLINLGALHENDSITTSEYKYLWRQVVNANSVHMYQQALNEVKKVYNQLLDIYEHVLATYKQTVGRTCRTFNKLPEVNIYLNEEMATKYLSFADNDYKLLPEEYIQSIKHVKLKVSNNFNKIENKDKTQRKAIKNTERFNSYLQVLLRKLRIDSEARLKWNILREQVLKHPTIDNIEDHIEFENLYIENKELSDKYYYIHNGDTQINTRSIEFFKSNESSNEVSEDDCKLSDFMKNEYLKNKFNELGYATKFENKKYILNPVAYESIYKGAIGEIVLRNILIDFLGIKFSEMPLSLHEVADDLHKSDDNKNIAFDYKHFNQFSFQTEHQSEMFDKIINKIDNFDKFIVINTTGENFNCKPCKIVDDKLICSSHDEANIYLISGVYDLKTNSISNELLKAKKWIL